MAVVQTFRWKPLIWRLLVSFPHRPHYDAPALHILLHNGDAHGEVEPVENVFRRFCHVLSDVDDGVATIGHEGHRLVLLPALILQHLVQPPFRLIVMALDETKIPAWAVRRDRFAHSDLKMRLSDIAGSDVSAIDPDGDWPFRIGKPLPQNGAGLDEANCSVNHLPSVSPRGQGACGSCPG